MSNTNGTEVRLKVEGMSCDHCVGRVRKALSDTPGVLEATVDLDRCSATVRTSREVPPAQLIAAVEKAGYSARAA